MLDINNPALEVNYFSKLEGLPLLKLNMIDGLKLLLGSTVVVLNINIFLIDCKYAKCIKHQKIRVFKTRRIFKSYFRNGSISEIILYFLSSYELQRLQLELSDLKQNDLFPPDLRRSWIGMDFGEEKNN